MSNPTIAEQLMLWSTPTTAAVAAGSANIVGTPYRRWWSSGEEKASWKKSKTSILVKFNFQYV
jgi:hypothetical protein